VDIRLFLCKVNKVTSPHRHGQAVSKRVLDDLSNAQIEMEAALKTAESQSENPTNMPIDQISAIEDYNKAVELGLTNIDRWGTGIDHHPMSERAVRFLAEHDLYDYDDHFCWKVGGDGDNGESLMYQLDAFFEMLDGKNRNQPESVEE
jgi:hypothetical protein